MIIDSQVHAYEANTPKRPWASVPNWPAHVTAAFGSVWVSAYERGTVARVDPRRNRVSHVYTVGGNPSGLAEAGGALVLQASRGRLHLAVEPPDDALRLAIEELDQLLDELVVALLGDLADTRPGALLDVEEEARPAEAMVLVVLARRAGADREAAQQ